MTPNLSFEEDNIFNGEDGTFFIGNHPRCAYGGLAGSEARRDRPKHYPTPKPGSGDQIFSKHITNIAKAIALQIIPLAIQGQLNSHRSDYNLAVSIEVIIFIETRRKRWQEKPFQPIQTLKPRRV